MDAFKLYVTDANGNTIDLTTGKTVPRLRNAANHYARGEVGISFSGHTISAATNLMLNDTPRGSEQGGSEQGGSIDIEALLADPDHVWTAEEIQALIEWLQEHPEYDPDNPGDNPDEPDTPDETDWDALWDDPTHIWSDEEWNAYDEWLDQTYAFSTILDDPDHIWTAEELIHLERYWRIDEPIECGMTFARYFGWTAGWSPAVLDYYGQWLNTHIDFTAMQGDSNHSWSTDEYTLLVLWHRIYGELDDDAITANLTTLFIALGWLPNEYEPYITWLLGYCDDFYSSVSDGSSGT